MKHFEIARQFIEVCRGSAKIEHLKSAFAQAVPELGFRYFACCSHVDPLHPPARAVVFQTYPAEWVERYSEEQLHVIDPVFGFAQKSLRPFSWDDAKFASSVSSGQKALLDTAATYGIAHGITVPLHLRWAIPASCSWVPESHGVDRELFPALLVMSVYLYEALQRERDRRHGTATRSRLPDRERQCLELAAHGKSDWATGAILGISERTVHNHIESAKRRLGVTTRVQAIVQGLTEGEIDLLEVANGAGRRNRDRPEADSELSENS